MDKLGLNLPGLIVQFVNFGILLFILWRFVLPPVQRMLDERRKRIQESLEAADRMRAQAQETERMLEDQRAEGRRQAQILEAEGFNQALKQIFDAARGVDEKTMSLQYLEALKALGASPSTKFVIPTEFTRLVEPLTGYINRGMGPGSARGSAD